jgi:hypothetical protein
VQTEVDLPCFDGIYTFRLGLAQIRELESKCDAGIGAIYARTLRGRYGLGDSEIMATEGDYRFSELIEVLRQGLIGGKHGYVDGVDILVSAPRAVELIQNYVLDGQDRMVMRQTWALAAAVLSALIEGYTPPKKAEPGESPATRTKGSTSRRRKPTAT